MRSPARVAFVDDHKRCGDRDGGLDSGQVWMACSCGAQIVHPAKETAPATCRAREPRGHPMESGQPVRPALP